MEDFNNIGKQVVEVHQELSTLWPSFRRIALALYDVATDELHTFVNATTGEAILPHYTQKLSNVPSLKELFESKKSRIVDDLNVFASHTSEHSLAIKEAGFRSSFTVPMLGVDDNLLGFIFYDASEASFFTPMMQEHLRLYSSLLRSLVITDTLPLKMLQAAVHVTQAVTRYKDEETGEHIARMSHYARLIGVSLADKWNLSDAFLNYLLLYSPLHDIGKVTIPDTILLKPGTLNDEEMAIMRTHVNKGVEIVELLLKEFGLGNIMHTTMLLNIVAYHHEKCDGSGYPYGLKAEEIPKESRIATVADVFDALTSDRPYREAWSVEAAFAYLVAHAGSYFDVECVEALLSQKAHILEVRAMFK